MAVSVPVSVIGALTSYSAPNEWCSRATRSRTNTNLLSLQLVEQRDVFRGLRRRHRLQVRPDVGELLIGHDLVDVRGHRARRFTDVARQLRDRQRRVGETRAVTPALTRVAVALP